jgi:hypothetical protein
VNAENLGGLKASAPNSDAGKPRKGIPVNEPVQWGRTS